MKSGSYQVFVLLAGAALLSACAGRHGGRHQQQQQDMLQLPDAPVTLQVQPGQILMLAAKGSGVQIYQCATDPSDSSRYKWIFKAPEAELTSARGRSLGKHYAGPTWEANDGSKVVAQVKASDKVDDPAAIPWLLLNATSNSGAGVFGRTNSIQRLFTAGGKAPQDGCDSKHQGQETRVSYTAQYYFYN